MGAVVCKVIAMSGKIQGGNNHHVAVLSQGVLATQP